MTMELIFEIGCEDLPARFVDPALEQLRDNFRERCEDLRISCDGVRVVGTPRRLTLLVSELAGRQEDLEEERTGPPANIAWDDDGAPTKAAEGFARGQGVDVDDLYTVETEKGEYVAAKVFEEGQPTAEFLPEILDGVMRSFTFPKSMRWATYPETYGRPVRWLVAVAGGEVVPLRYAGVESGRLTQGHRFAGPKPALALRGIEKFAGDHGRGDEATKRRSPPDPEPFEVESIEQYLRELERHHVVVDPDERRQQIEALLEARANVVDGVVLEDPELVDEVVHLVETPHAVLVEYGEDYLELPDEVLISSMRSHQRYFAVAGDDGNLKSACVVVYNTPVPNPDVVREGNLRVLQARLDDAVFFWEQDLRRPLESYVEELADVVWLKQIGTVKDRCSRISLLAAHIAEALELDEELIDAARRAGYLSKADLVTNMVGEFPDLQGVMGREYALKDDETEAVAAAIYEQYLPKGADDVLPATHAGACVALAEKLEALVGCFGVGLIPSSTADPYALRRASIGTIRILQGREYSVSLPKLIRMAWEVYQELDPDALDREREEIEDDLIEFFRTRLKHQLASEYPTDVVAAVLAVGMDDVLSVTDRVEAIVEIREEEDFEPLATGFKRVVNILEKQAEEYDPSELTGDPSLLEEGAEEALHAAFVDASEDIDAALANRDWSRACRVLIGLKQPIDDFFDEVMVMADDPELKRNRIALLFALQGLFLRVADISIIG